MSDHGHSTEERTMFGGGYAGPYRGAKFSLFEGGIRVPAIVSLPGVVPAGQVRDQLATAVDWLPTIAEVTGARLPGAKIDGKSLLTLIQSGDAPPCPQGFSLATRQAVGRKGRVLEADWQPSRHRQRVPRR